MIYLQLFLSYLKIGFFGFGGGYPMISLIYNEIVTRHAWLTQAQFTDIVAVSQMTPGPIALNCATFVGYTVTGSIWGSVLTTLAVCAPSMTLMLLIAIFYRRLQGNRLMMGALNWMRPVLAGLIGAAAVMFLNRETFFDWKTVLICVASFAAVWKKVNPVWVLLASAAIGLAIF
ncbi:MAG: chromate transporter [Bacteroidaceae bacterium]|nr:chromate transporter [Bacteroidaceae bacterium]